MRLYGIPLKLYTLKTEYSVEEISKIIRQKIDIQHPNNHYFKSAKRYEGFVYDNKFEFRSRQYVNPLFVRRNIQFAVTAYCKIKNNEDNRLVKVFITFDPFTIVFLLIFFTIAIFFIYKGISNPILPIFAYIVLILHFEWSAFVLTRRLMNWLKGTFE
jgi:hypothetical protein